MLAIFFLIAISIIFPYFWLLTIGYIVYLIATKNQRRNKVIMDEVRRSITHKRDQVILDYLYFDSAISFAADHGADLSKRANTPSQDSLQIVLNIDGKNYEVTFQRGHNDETLLAVCAVEDAKEAEERLLLKNSA